MSPDPSNSPRHPSDPLSPFVQLVVPASALSSSGFNSVDTSCDETKVNVDVFCSLIIESLDDTLAEEFPLVGVRGISRIREAIEDFIATIRMDVSRSFFGEGMERSSEDAGAGRSVSIRYGAARLSALEAPVVWIECRCQETEAYLLPNVKLGDAGVKWFHDQIDQLPERFFDGPARLLVELDPHTFAIVSCRPLISPQCAPEAESNFVAAVQGMGIDSSSYLLCQYYDFVVAHAVSDGEVEAGLTEQERRTFLSRLARPALVGVSTSSDRTWTVSLRYPETHQTEAYLEEVYLREISPWGLTVTGVTRLPEAPSL